MYDTVRNVSDKAIGSDPQLVVEMLQLLGAHVIDSLTALLQSPTNCLSTYVLLLYIFPLPSIRIHNNVN